MSRTTAVNASPRLSMTDESLLGHTLNSSYLNLGPYACIRASGEVVSIACARVSRGNVK